MSQLVGMASGEYRHHLVTIWPLTHCGPVPSPSPFPLPFVPLPLLLHPSLSLSPIAMPLSLSQKDPQKRKL